MKTWITELITSDRVKLFIAGLLVTAASKYAPTIGLTQEQALAAVGLIAALILSQINRPLIKKV